MCLSQIGIIWLFNLFIQLFVFCLYVVKQAFIDFSVYKLSVREIRFQCNFFSQHILHFKK